MTTAVMAYLAPGMLIFCLSSYSPVIREWGGKHEPWAVTGAVLLSIVLWPLLVVKVLR
jgi:hypothetical protein